MDEIGGELALLFSISETAKAMWRGIGVCATIRPRWWGAGDGRSSPLAKHKSQASSTKQIPINEI
jgi:hypothetical protein